MPQSLPKWLLLINLDSTWKFYGSKLFHREKISHATSHEELKGGKISKWIIKNCYAVFSEAGASHGTIICFSQSLAGGWLVGNTSARHKAFRCGHGMAAGFC